MSTKVKRGLPWSPDGTRNLSKTKSGSNLTKATSKDAPKPSSRTVKGPRATSIEASSQNRPTEDTKALRCNSQTVTVKVTDAKRKNTKSTTANRPLPSCTILEDRALLKKGLSGTPPKKPDELRGKKSSPVNNNKSSLWAGQGQTKGQTQVRGGTNDGPNKITPRKTQQVPLKRSTSLWTVSPGKMTNQAGLKPSRIPLSTHNQSLVNLTVAITPVEIAEISVDEADRSLDEKVYKNSQKADDKEMEFELEPLLSSPIYENLKLKDAEMEKQKKKQLNDELKNSQMENKMEVIITTVDYNKGADLKMEKKGEIGGTLENNFSKSREEISSFRKKDGFLNKSRSLAKSHEILSRRQEPELCIQEIRQNWEKQIRQSQDLTDLKVNKISFKPKMTLHADSLSKSTKHIQKTMEIKELVKFFNCKNMEISNNNVHGNWKKEFKEDKSNGYTSDGNCSEDSGHISNENDLEPHEESRNNSKESINEEKFMIKDVAICNSEMNLPRNIEVFHATAITHRYVDSPIKRLDERLEKSNDALAIVAIDGWEKRVNANQANFQTEQLKSTIKIQVQNDDSNKLDNDLADKNQIFFRAGGLERLEAQRDEKLTGHIILLQARCRGYLARRKLNTLKLQDLAVRCIQRNVRKLMSVREWPWWRLYVKVAPLLNVHRTEDQLKAKTEELEVLRAKLEKLEQERNHLKHDNERLEAKLSEMTADFAEEHSTSTLAAERIDAETSERLRLERELQDVTEANKNLQQTTERLEMELLYARAADLNGIVSDGEDGEDGGVYKQRYEHAMRELEFTKRKMAQQHEDDLEQLVGLKKQLEKKLADAYEEVEEQRQVVGQWKRRVQKLNGEMHDLRLLLEEQNARNNLLEKKQRKFDSETQNLMDDLRQEKAQRERLAREKEIAIAEKFTVEQNLSDARLEIELKEERLHSLTQELEELTFGGKTEEEVAQLKKMKHELEKKVKDQEEELDDLAGQVQLLEQAKLRLEMSIEQQRKEMRKEMQQRDEELEDVRGNAHKKVKALEAQLENEHEERTILLREKHELERRLVALEEQDRTDRAAEAEMLQRLKRDLKRTKALLRDAQTMLERSKGDSGSKAALRQLKNQLEDAECARALAVKAKQALEQDLSETQAAYEEAMRARSEAEDRANLANRERAELLSQLEENEEELAEVLKKYRAAVQQVSAEQVQLQDAQVQIASLEAEKSALKDQLSELSQRLESVEQLGDPTANSLATRRLEFRTKELESKLELEQTTRARLETQIARLKETVEKLQSESAIFRTKEQSAQDTVRRLQRSLREAKEEAQTTSTREQEATRMRRDLEKALEAAEAETKVVKDDLRLALQRIDDLQSAIQGDLDLDCSEETTSENSDSD